MTNPLLELGALGQSVWLDDIDREQLHSGLFRRLIEEGVQKFTDSFLTLFQCIDNKRKVLQR